MVKNGWIRVWSTVLLETLLLFVGIVSSVNLGDTKDWFSLDTYVCDEDYFATFGKFIPIATHPKDKPKLLDEKCIQDSELVVKAILNQTEWVLSSK